MPPALLEFRGLTLDSATELKHLVPTVVLRCSAVLLADFSYRGADGDGPFGVFGLGGRDKTWWWSHLFNARVQILLLSLALLVVVPRQLHHVIKLVVYVFLQRVALALSQIYVTNRHQTRKSTFTDVQAEFCPRLTFSDIATSSAMDVCICRHSDSSPPDRLRTFDIGKSESTLDSLIWVALAAQFVIVVVQWKIVRPRQWITVSLLTTHLVTMMLCVVGAPRTVVSWASAVGRLASTTVVLPDLVGFQLDSFVMVFALNVVIHALSGVIGMAVLAIYSVLVFRNRNTVSVSWLAFGCVRLVALLVAPSADDGRLQPHDTSFWIDQLTSSPFALVSFCAVLGSGSQVLFRLTSCWIDFDHVDGPPLLPDVSQSVARLSVLLLTDVYLFGLSGSNAKHVVVITVVVTSSVLFGPVFRLAEPHVLSPERHRFPWRRFRALLVYLVLVACPFCSTYIVYVQYGTTDWSFALVAPIVLQAFKVLTSFARWIVDVVDEWLAGDGFDDVRRVVQWIQISVLTVCCLCSFFILTCLLVSLFVGHQIFWTAAHIFTLFDLTVHGPYLELRSTFARWRRVADLVSRYPAPPGECSQLDDVCPICYVELRCRRASHPDTGAVSGGCLLTPCGHVYHRRCLAAWLDIQAWCPTCRAVLEGPDSPAAALVDTTTWTEMLFLQLLKLLRELRE